MKPPTLKPQTETERVLKFIEDYKKLDQLSKEILKSIMNDKLKVKKGS